MEKKFREDGHGAPRRWKITPSIATVQLLEHLLRRWQNTVYWIILIEQTWKRGLKSVIVRGKDANTGLYTGGGWGSPFVGQSFLSKGVNKSLKWMAYEDAIPYVSFVECSQPKENVHLATLQQIAGNNFLKIGDSLQAFLLNQDSKHMFSIAAGLIVLLSNLIS